MKKGIPCNETQFTNGRNRNRIIYQFVSDDGNTPSLCTIHLDDTDPITGEVITDISFFREYYRIVDHEIHQNLKCQRPNYTKDAKTRRKEEIESYVNTFIQSYGYAPSRDDIRFHMEQIETSRYNLYLDELMNEDGESMIDYKSEFGQTDMDPFGTDLPDDIYALREIAESLTGRLKAVYEAMPQKAAAGSDRITYTEIARIWGVSYNQIMKDTRKIEKMIREKVGQTLY